MLVSYSGLIRLTRKIPVVSANEVKEWDLNLMLCLTEGR